MAKLERWQRHLSSNPCEICGGYGAYKPEHRCAGFRSLDGKGTYCSKIPNGRSPKWFESLQMDMWFHPKDGGEGEQDFLPTGKLFSRRHSILAMRQRGLDRRHRRLKEASTKPTWKDWA